MQIRPDPGLRSFAARLVVNVTAVAAALTVAACAAPTPTAQPPGAPGTTGPSVTSVERPTSAELSTREPIPPSMVPPTTVTLPTDTSAGPSSGPGTPRTTSPSAGPGTSTGSPSVTTPQEEVRLANTRWLLVSAMPRNGRMFDAGDSGARLQIVAGRLMLNTGCNTGGGGVTFGDLSIRFTGVVTTRMACAEDRMKVERVVVAALDGSLDYRIEGDRLTLTGEAGTLVYRAAQPGEGVVVTKTMDGSSGTGG